MKHLSMGLLILTCWTGLSAETDAGLLLTKWCDAMLARQVKDTGDVALDGALMCPACGLFHGRIGDLCYPLTVLWVRTGDRKYLDGAIAAVKWTETNMLRPDQGWANDYQARWKGIVTFSQIAFGKTLLAYSDRLPQAVAQEWRRIFVRHSDFLIKLFYDTPTFHPVINYPCSFVECMALSWKVTGETRYREYAERMLRETVKPSFMEDGLLTGEGRVLSRTKNDFAYVDFGYNLEESLPALLEASEILGDRDLEEKVVKAARVHLEVMLPDGAIDNSSGSRSAKWTYYGSRTSDGVLPLLAGLAKRGEPCAARAFSRHLALLVRCTSDRGLLYGGLHYADADEYPCIHHTFAHAKALAAVVDEKLTDGGAPMPRELAPKIKTFDSIGTTLAAIGPWRATFAAHDGSQGDLRAAVTGGSVTMLWHEKFGPVFAASMNKYWYAERHNFQDTRHQDFFHSTTPRIEAGKFTNVEDATARGEGKLEDGVFTYEAHGNGFKLGYRMEEKSFAVTASCEKDYRYVFPVIGGNETRVTVDGRTALVEYPSGKLKIVASAPIGLERTERGEKDFVPVAGLMTTRLYVSAQAGQAVSVTLDLD